MNRQPRTRPSQEDVAKALGIDKSTVSRALRNDPRLAPETVARVKAKVRAMGYERDAVLSELAGRRWRRPVGDATGSVLALVIGGPTTARNLETGFNARLVDGARRRAAELGYKIEVFGAPDAAADAAISRTTYSRGIRGLMLKGSFARTGPWGVDLGRFSAINVGMDPFPAPVDSVRPNLFRSMWECLDRCHAKGYRQPGLVVFGKPLPRGELRRTGAFFSWHLSGGIEAVPVLCLPPRPGRSAENNRMLGGWMKRHEPDVIIGQNSAVIGMLGGLGRRVPADIPFVSLHADVDAVRWVSGQITGILGTEGRVGAAAVEWLDTLIRCGIKGEQENPHALLITQDFQEGTTLPDRG